MKVAENLIFQSPFHSNAVKILQFHDRAAKRGPKAQEVFASASGMAEVWLRWDGEMFMGGGKSGQSNSPPPASQVNFG